VALEVTIHATIDPTHNNWRKQPVIMAYSMTTQPVPINVVDAVVTMHLSDLFDEDKKVFRSYIDAGVRAHRDMFHQRVKPTVDSGSSLVRLGAWINLTGRQCR
jgi:hypothetical protein